MKKIILILIIHLLTTSSSQSMLRKIRISTLTQRVKKILCKRRYSTPSRQEFKRMQQSIQGIKSNYQALEGKYEGLKKLVAPLILKNNRNSYIHEQIRALQKKEPSIADTMRMRLKTLPIADEHKRQVMNDINDYEKCSDDQSEKRKLETYFSFLFDLPWNISTKEKHDLKDAEKTLDEDHFGMHQVKKQILNMIAIKQLNPDGSIPNICLIGPAGTGKTSIAQSLAHTLDRKFGRLSLGGVRDETIFRGHRRTYASSMPGDVISQFRRAQTNNPVILLDEIDKIERNNSSQAEGALFELLDPEQNKKYMDHYLNIPFDVSKALFVATANYEKQISKPLLDRMQVIEIKGYAVNDKMIIAKQFLIKRALKKAGLIKNELELKFSDDVIKHVIEHHTNHEPGIRQLERQLNELVAHAAYCFVKHGKLPIYTTKNIEHVLGKSKTTNLHSNIL